MPVQRRNDELVSMLGGDMQKRYESAFAWGAACSTIQALTGLRGFWPMSAFESSGNAFDLSGNGRTLTYNGNPTYNFDGLAPYIRLDGTGDFLSRTDEAGLDILGTETYVAAGHKGLTMGGWFRPEDATVDDILMSKWAGAGSYSYLLGAYGTVAGDPIRFYISDDGLNFDLVTSTNGFSTNTWHFMACRFNDSDTGAELAIWLDGTMTTAATARASINNSNADFVIGSISGGGSNLFTGRCSMCFLCAAALADATVATVYQRTRALFKV